MRILAILLAITMAAATPLINEIYANPAEGDTEFLEIHNPGPAVNMTGWTLHDAANNTFTFPQFTLQTNSYVVIGLDYAWQTVWNNGGDTATLRDANGTIVDEVTFGATSKGQSIARPNWLEGNTTPGYAAEQSGAQLQVQVQEVAPELTIEAPPRVKTGAAVPVTYKVQDGNGDLAHWALSSDTVIATGNNATMDVETLTAPSPGEWVLTLTATDAFGHEATMMHPIQVALSDLILHIESIQFPALAPGSVAESTPFTVQHAGWHDIAPILDVSDFTGPGVIAANQLEVFWGEWIPYNGGILTLPTMAPGEEQEVRFRLNVPEPLPAGMYGTSFTVTA